MAMRNDSGQQQTPTSERKPSSQSKDGPDSQVPRQNKRKQLDTYLGPEDAIGEGDSRVLYDLVLPPNAFENIRDEVTWQKMYHLSGQVPRLVAVQGQCRSNGLVPIYRHPADESPPLQPLTPTVDQIRVIVERILGHPLNHVLIQRYRDGQDCISEHSDKTLDIVRGSFICNVSLGAQRVMVLRTKASGGERDKQTESGRRSQRVPLPHESLFILGEKTNMRWLHGIRPDKRPDSVKSAEDRAYGGERISLTFRYIGTFTHPVVGTIWGQGAVSKSEEQAGAVVHGDAGQTEQLIRAFGQENHETEFDWDAVYGKGFNVVNFVTAATAKLVLSGDSLIDLRVRLCLEESGLRHEVTDPTDSGVEERPLYISQEGAIVGDFNILVHLGERAPTRPGVDTLSGGGKLLQIEEFLKSWREYRGGEIKKGFAQSDSWEQYFAQDSRNYLNGNVFGIDDCSLWPVLREVEQETDLLSAARYPRLCQYYDRVGKRGCVRAVLEEMAV